MMTFWKCVLYLKRILYGVIVGVVVLGVWIGAASLLNLALDETESAKDLVEIIQLFVVASAIVIGGFFAIYKLQIFRDFEPHLTVSQEVSHRFVSDEYIHVETTATLYNSSRVKIEIRKGLFRLQQIAPTSDEQILELYTQVFIDEKSKHLQWPTLWEVDHNWDANGLIVEPGESHHETYEFIVSKDVTSIMVYAYFYNSRFPKSPAEGWGAATVHDILGSTSNSA